MLGVGLVFKVLKVLKVLPMEHPGRASSSQEFKVMGSFRVYFFDVSLGGSWEGVAGGVG